MNIKLIVVGKTTEVYLQKGIDEYTKRLTRYVKFQMDVVIDVKKGSSLSIKELKEMEGDLILNKIKNNDVIILLDEQGEEFTSPSFARLIEKMNLNSVKNVVFVVGGSYGFSEKLYKRADRKIALSQMTFSHQMIRLLFIEQLYRAQTIIKGEPYHHI